MNGLQTLALTLVAGWLAVLTLVLVLVVRQIGLLTVRFQAAGRVGDSGLPIGAAVPAEARRAMPTLKSEVVYLLFISPTCGPCHEVVSELGDLELDAFEGQLVAVLSHDDEVADDLARMVPTAVKVVRDPSATDIARALEIAATPFVLHIEDGMIAGKAFIHDGAGLVRLMEARDGKRTDRSNGSIRPELKDISELSHVS